MRLQVNGLNISLTEEILDHVDKRFRFALDRLEPALRRVAIRLCDENGPRGGRDKECRVVASLASGETVVLREKGENLLNVVDRVAEKTKRAVQKRIEKKRAGRRHDSPFQTGTNGSVES